MRQFSNKRKRQTDFMANENNKKVYRKTIAAVSVATDIKTKGVADVKDDEYLCDLQYEGLFCLQKKKGYGFTNDAVYLANFIKCDAGARAVEFCSGSGVISILFGAKQPVKEITCIEIQPQLADMSRRSIALNAIKNIMVENTSVQKFCSEFNAAPVDLVFVNPPYYKVGSGKLPANAESRLARFETEITIDEINGAAKILKTDGAFYLVHSYARIDEIKLCLARNGFGVECVVPISVNKQKAPHIFMCKAIKGRIGLTETKPTIFIN